MFAPGTVFSKPHSEPRFTPPAGLNDMTKQDWREITEDVFKRLFPKSPVKRAKLTGLKRNIDFLDEGE